MKNFTKVFLVTLVFFIVHPIKASVVGVDDVQVGNNSNQNSNNNNTKNSHINNTGQTINTPSGNITIINNHHHYYPNNHKGDKKNSTTNNRNFFHTVGDWWHNLWN